MQVFFLLVGGYWIVVEEVVVWVWVESEQPPTPRPLEQYNNLLSCRRIFNSIFYVCFCEFNGMLTCIQVA
jgi:hypothetical protein